jgi:hypothetical protein
MIDVMEGSELSAVEAAGQMAAVTAESGLEPVREVLRRVIWLMNDESGGVLWQGPEILGEILVQVPDLRPEFAPLLPPYLVEEPFERGWYAGPVGFFDASGNGVFVPALRSAVARGESWRLFAGAGIVSASDPEAEWDETGIKFEPVLRALARSGAR